jgi:hypothetical protein
VKMPYNKGIETFQKENEDGIIKIEENYR